MSIAKAKQYSATKQYTGEEIAALHRDFTDSLDLCQKMLNFMTSGDTLTDDVVEDFDQDIYHIGHRGE